MNPCFFRFCKQKFTRRSSPSMQGEELVYTFCYVFIIAVLIDILGCYVESLKSNSQSFMTKNRVKKDLTIEQYTVPGTSSSSCSTSISFTPSGRPAVNKENLFTFFRIEKLLYNSTNMFNLFPEDQTCPSSTV